MFLQKSNLLSDAIEITENYPDIEMEEPYVLFVPSMLKNTMG